MGFQDLQRELVTMLTWRLMQAERAPLVALGKVPPYGPLSDPEKDLETIAGDFLSDMIPVAEAYYRHLDPAAVVREFPVVANLEAVRSFDAGMGDELEKLLSVPQVSVEGDSSAPSQEGGTDFAGEKAISDEQMASIPEQIPFPAGCMREDVEKVTQDLGFLTLCYYATYLPEMQALSEKIPQAVNAHAAAHNWIAQGLTDLREGFETGFFRPLVTGGWVPVPASVVADPPAPAISDAKPERDPLDVLLNFVFSKIGRAASKPQIALGWRDRFRPDGNSLEDNVLCGAGDFFDAMSLIIDGYAHYRDPIPVIVELNKQAFDLETVQALDPSLGARVEAELSPRPEDFPSQFAMDESGKAVLVSSFELAHDGRFPPTEKAPPVLPSEFIIPPTVTREGIDLLVRDLSHLADLHFASMGAGNAQFEKEAPGTVAGFNAAYEWTQKIFKDLAFYGPGDRISLGQPGPTQYEQNQKPLFLSAALH